MFSEIFERRKNGTTGGGNGTIIELTGIRKVYDMGAVQVEALRGVDLAVRPGEFVSVVGPSGSGKSTLMNIVGCLDTPSGGSYLLKDEEVGSFSLDRLAEVRNRRIGFVFQNFNLLPQLTAFENVELPLLFAGMATKARRERTEQMLADVGLADRMSHKPTELSGGQMQRVAIARALACQPDLLLADEPTGNLDSTSGRDILHVFEELWEGGHTLLVITHDPAIAHRAPRTVTMQDGLIVGDEQRAA
jgi:putative ABC transport system ATP-binding protein